MMRWLVLFSLLVSAVAQPRKDLIADTLAAQRRYLEANASPLDMFGDSVTMTLSCEQRAEDQQIERALQELHA